ncbi:MAG: GIY-YIG nuclease family protein [Verrucomicrobiota bacterium]
MDSTQPHWVYVIRNTQGQHYIGVSVDPEHRLVQHNTGESKWTRNHLPWRLVWNQEYPTLSEARKVESFLKRQKGGQGFYNFTGLQKEQPGSSSGS